MAIFGKKPLVAFWSALDSFRRFAGRLLFSTHLGEISASLVGLRKLSAPCSGKNLFQENPSLSLWFLSESVAISASSVSHPFRKNPSQGKNLYCQEKPMTLWENLCWEKFRKTHYLFEKDLFRKTHDFYWGKLFRKTHNCFWEKPILSVLRVGRSLGTLGSLQNHEYSVTCQTHASLLIQNQQVNSFYGSTKLFGLARPFPRLSGGPGVEFCQLGRLSCRWRCKLALMLLNSCHSLSIALSSTS